jgi:hypothetical protein
MTTNFLASFQQQVIKDNVKIGDTVTVIGKDQYKGLHGTVTRYYCRIECTVLICNATPQYETNNRRSSIYHRVTCKCQTH